MQLLQQSVQLVQNFDGSFDGHNPNGDKNPTLTWTTSLPVLTNQPSGTAISVNVRAFLSGDGSSLATITVVYLSGDAVTNWVSPGAGDNLTNPASSIGAGIFLLRASYLGLTIDSGPISWSINSGVTGRVKWNPGHYMGGLARQLSNTALTSAVQNEIDNLNGWDNILGYQLHVTWGLLDVGPQSFTGSVGGATSGTLTASLTSATYWFGFSNGQYRKVTVTGTACTWVGALNAGTVTTADAYNFNGVDLVFNRLKTQYNKPKRLVLVPLPGSFTSSGPAGPGTIPAYILNNSIYGASPVSGSFGWWGGTNNGHTYAACLHRTAVNNRWIKLIQAIGAYYDPDPLYEATIHQENSWISGAASTNGCPDFGEIAWDTNARALIVSCIPFYPTTSFIYQNTYQATVTPTQNFQVFMYNNRVAPGTADTAGKSYLNANNGTLLTWGMETYQGKVIAGSGATGIFDMRPTSRCMIDVEAPDEGATFNTLIPPSSRFSTGATDLLPAINQDYQASHVFWGIVFANSNPWPNCIWSTLAPFLNDPANALTHTAYPSNYP